MKMPKAKSKKKSTLSPPHRVSQATGGKAPAGKKKAQRKQAPKTTVPDPQTRILVLEEKLAEMV